MHSYKNAKVLWNVQVHVTVPNCIVELLLPVHLLENAHVLHATRDNTQHLTYMPSHPFAFRERFPFQSFIVNAPNTMATNAKTSAKKIQSGAGLLFERSLDPMSEKYLVPSPTGSLCPISHDAAAASDSFSQIST